MRWKQKTLAQTLCRQDTKIGADSLIICDTSQHHISMVSYSRSGMRQPLNGNGIACLVQYCCEYGFLLEREAYIKMDAALVRAKIKRIEPFTTAVYLPPAIFSAESCCIPESVCIYRGNIYRYRLWQSTSHHCKHRKYILGNMVWWISEMAP